MSINFAKSFVFLVLFFTASVTCGQTADLRLNWDSNPDNRVHSVWSKKGAPSESAELLGQNIQKQVKVFCGASESLASVKEKLANGENKELKQNLYKACIYAVVETLDVESNSRFQPTANSTYCNIYAYDVVQAMGGYIPRIWWSKTIE